MSNTLLTNISGRLRIELTEPPERITPALSNQKAPPTAVIKSLRLEASLFENGNIRELTDGELSETILERGEITLRSEGTDVHHVSSNGSSFTLRELLQAIEETERQTRPRTEWFGGVDVHHVYFEGLHLADDGSWEIYWGS